MTVATPPEITEIDLTFAYQVVLSALKLEPHDGTADTPRRAACALLELTAGYHVNPDELVRTFEERHDEVVAVSGVAFWSLCEHHLLPFHGRAHVAYIPAGKVVGLSKIPRVIDAYARRLQVQERLTQEIADCLQRNLDPVGVMVVLEAEHLCMSIRGVQRPGAITRTSVTRGAFRDKPEAREEALALFGK
jgi:GTP cyclohydrolase I